MSEQLHFATELAEEAGSIMRQRRNEGDLKIQIKPDGTPVTMVDKEINDLVIDAITKQYPEHAVLGEEASHGDLNGSDIWVVDPLDGTRNFIRGGDGCTVGIARLREGIPELGIIYNPFREEMYTAHVDSEHISISIADCR